MFNINYTLERDLKAIRINEINQFGNMGILQYVRDYVNLFIFKIKIEINKQIECTLWNIR